MPATGGSEEPAAPVPSTVPPDSEQVVLTEEDEIAELGAVPTADPDRAAEDEAADEGDLQPRQFPPRPPSAHRGSRETPILRHLYHPPAAWLPQLLPTPSIA